MENINSQRRFNVRVYGLWVQDGQVLINDERIKSGNVIKFPGGGLEYGEGLIEGLKREWQEELGIDIAVLEHFYTTDFFQQSAYDQSQVISIFYLVAGDSGVQIVNKNDNERTYWHPIAHINHQTFTFPIENRVGGLLCGRFAV